MTIDTLAPDLAACLHASSSSPLTLETERVAGGVRVFYIDDVGVRFDVRLVVHLACLGLFEVADDVGDAITPSPAGRAMIRHLAAAA